MALETTEVTELNSCTELTNHLSISLGQTNEIFYVIYTL